MSKINPKIFLIFLFSILSSISLSFFYISLYDAYQLDQTSHIMLKEETYAHWSGAAVIIEQLKDGVSFFVAGGEHYTKPLMRRIVVLYSLVTNHQIMDGSINYKIALGGKISFLIYQSIFYYFSVYIFYTQASKIFNKLTVYFIIIFLCIEPTLFQYHSSFWTESFYFSIQLLLLSMMLSSKESNLKFVIMGVLVGLLFLQRSAGIFYIIIISLYYLLTANEKKINKVVILLIFFLTICFTVGLHNLKRAGVFYVMPTEGNYSMYRYFAKGVLKDSKGYSSDNEVNKIETNKALNWVNNNIPDLEYLNDLDLNSPYVLGLKIKDEKKKVKFFKYLNKRAYQILLENPITALKNIIKGMIHFSVLNPFFVYYDYEHFKDYGSHIIGDFSFSEKAKELIPIRITYSLIIYIISFFGIIECFKKNPKVTLLLLSSVLYYYVLLGWYGKTRLFVPNLIYISIFFGNGLNMIINKIKAKI
jgi:4-amino-4-deoxy-L-arabinose transferase-like glycosyltransferase